MFFSVGAESAGKVITMKSSITSPVTSSVKKRVPQALNASFKNLGLTLSLFLGAALSLQSLSAQAEDVALKTSATESSSSVSYGFTSDHSEDSQPTYAPLNLQTPGGFSDSYITSVTATDLGAASDAALSGAHYSLRSSHLQRYQVDQGTRMTGWQLGEGLYFGRSKGELKGVALIWQRSQTAQVSLSGNGLRLTRRIN